MKAGGLVGDDRGGCDGRRREFSSQVVRGGVCLGGDRGCQHEREGAEERDADSRFTPTPQKRATGKGAEENAAVTKGERGGWP